jgi:hypothetical protein
MKASNPKEIEGILRDDKSGLRERVVRNLGDFTVALLAICNGSNERLALAGTGTLVVIDKAHFILTARHVWDEVLSKADQIGLTLKPEIDHKYGVARKEFAVFGLPKPAEWNEWGPDLVLLRIPAESVGTIGAYKSYWNVQRLIDINAEVLEVTVLMGTPAALGEFNDTHAELTITGMFLGPEKAQERDGFDYLDYEMDLSYPEVPRNFGGVSGGGVWRVFLFCSRGEEIDWKMSFHGTAYYQLQIVDNHRTIRCHGPKTITAILSTIR